jgi:Ecdysteroid kinase-like family
MNRFFQNKILTTTKASNIKEIETIQELWSGYGKILRYELEGSFLQSVVVKHVRLPKNTKGIRKASHLSHERKVKSYRVESSWYFQWSQKCNEQCRIPKCLGIEKQGEEVLMILEDLDASGFSQRRYTASWTEMELALSWLANFHGTFMGEKPENLWKIGTYWHLATRTEELKALKDIPLKKAASKIDQKLNQTPFKTFVHGDAKLANFCFSDDGESVAAVDFQYVGGGCGMKDVAYFIGSCLNEDECELWESDLLDFYFDCLKTALSNHNSEINIIALEQNWRELYHFAWTDFHRFYKGWSPGTRWKDTDFSERTAKEILNKFQK